MKNGKEHVALFLQEKIELVTNSFGSNCKEKRSKDCDFLTKNSKFSMIDDNCYCQVKALFLLNFVKCNIDISVVEFLTKRRPEEIEVFEYDPIDNIKSTKNINLYKDKLEKYIDNFDGKVKEDGLSLIFSGPNSTGKTFAASYVLSVLLQKGHSCFYITFKDLYYLYNSTISRNEDLKYNSNDVYNYIMNCEIIVLDEMGKETFSESALVALEQFIKYRSGKNLPTIIITNLNVEQKYDSTLGSKDKSEFAKRYGNSIVESLKVNYFFFIFKKEKENNMRDKARKVWI